jgi:predicted ATPase/DNA-binding XRE family transcriptional regulator
MQEEIPFGKWLRKQRRVLDLSRQAFANQVGCAEVTLRRIEAGTLKPSTELASLLLEKLGIPETERPQWISFARGLTGFPPSTIASSNKPITNLPSPLTTFIGREKEQADVIQLITKHRLVTLTGSGGVGKTRFAIKIGEQLLENYPDGVWLVELAPLADPALVPQTVAAILGAEERTSRPILATLIDHLRGKRLLLILDNCERLIQASAEVAESLLRSCPFVHILATSRELLGVAGEKSFRVPSLSFPDSARPIQVDSLTQYESVRLFVDRALTAFPGFALTDDNALAVAQVCHWLDGIPLAIELAGARIELLRVEQIAERLDNRFQLLTGGGRTALPRHQTLSALIDWSHDLLTEPERILLRRLSVFAGGWMLDAAEAVCVGDGIEQSHILDLLTQLVNKSLVIAERAQGEEARFRILETIRQYALEKLKASGEADTLRKRHAMYYLVLAEAVVITQLLPAWQDPVQTEYDNIRVALAWSQSAQGNADLGLRLAGALAMFWTGNPMYWREGTRWMEDVLANADVEQVDNIQLRARILEGLGFISVFQRNYEAGEIYFAKCQILFQELGDVSSSAMALGGLGVLARERGDTTTARLRLEESLATFRKLGEKRSIASTLNTLGEVLVMQEDAEGATRLLDESLTLSQELGDLSSTHFALNHLGHVAQLQGEYERATRLHQESLVLFDQIGPRHGMSMWAHHSLGETALAQKNSTLAGTHFIEALELCRDLGDDLLMAWCLGGLAGVAALNEEPERAAWLWGAADALRQSIGGRPAPAARATHEQLQAQVRKQLGEARFYAKWAAGQVASAEEAICEAQRQ